MSTLTLNRALAILLSELADGSNFGTLGELQTELSAWHADLLSGAQHVNDYSPDQWLSIDLAPRDGSPILGCHIGRSYVPITAYWATFHPNAEGKMCWRDAPICGRKLELTHFMPLPAPHPEQRHD